MRGLPLGPQHAPEHSAALPAEADVAIIGGGIIGVTTALYLARKGLRPVILEKGRVAAEQSSRNWGWIRQMGRDLAELPIMMEASRLWRELADASGEDLGLKRCGLTFFARNDNELSEYSDWAEEARGFDLDTRVLSGSQASALIPAMSHDWCGALHTPSDMRAEPWVAVPALARLAAREGATIIENCAVRALDIEAGRIAGVITEKGRIRAPQVLVAGGAWSGLFLARHGIRLPQLSVRATVIATEALPDIHAGGVLGDGLAYRRRADGGYTLAPSGWHEFGIGPDALRHAPKYLAQLRRDPFGRRYQPTSPRHFPDAWGTKRRWQADEESPFERLRVLDPAPNRARADEVMRRFGQLFPEIGEVKPHAIWAGMIDTMPDIVPVVDRVSTLPGLSICTGMCGHGFGIGPGFGRIMADLITNSAPGHDLSRFRLSRFSDGSKLQLGPDL